MFQLMVIYWFLLQESRYWCK